MHIINIDLPPQIAFNHHLLTDYLKSYLNIDEQSSLLFKVQKRSLDARRLPLKSKLRIAIYESDREEASLRAPKLSLSPLKNAPQVIIVGAGPAGLFAALRAISLGLKPIILERGQQVRERRHTLAILNRTGLVDPESNYCFGEGGAGTYSDGKLYTRSKKRGSVRAVLQLLVDHGAPEEILYEAQPHIGTNRLPKIIQAIRETIITRGGEVHFQTKVTNLIISSEANRQVIRGVILSDGREMLSDQGVILATGHSARDIFERLHRLEIKIEAKPFAMGVRVEHPQALIDQIQYHGRRPPELGSAAYKIVTQVEQRGVFSFCMCPGGIIAPAATSPGEVVVNGWSPYKRNGRFANSGVVVSVDEQDFEPFAITPKDPLAGMRFQASVEKRAYEHGGKDGVTAPAQRLLDFIKNRPSTNLPDCSYIPGLKPALLNQVLPTSVEKRLRIGFQQFTKRLKGYLSEEAIVVGVESRTSSPVRIPRDRESLEHPDVMGLFPCGEGAGYAGGIVSAALDGFRCAEAVAKKSKQHIDEWSKPLSIFEDLRGGIGS